MPPGLVQILLKRGDLLVPVGGGGKEQLLVAGLDRIIGGHKQLTGLKPELLSGLLVRGSRSSCCCGPEEGSWMNRRVRFYPQRGRLPPHR